MPVKPIKKSKTEQVVTDPQTGRKTYYVKGKIVGTSATSTYAKGTSSIDTNKPKKKPSASVNKTPSVEERMQRFKNDPKAKAAVDYMTTSKGYQPDPLRARGGSLGGAKTTTKKGTGVKPKMKVIPKFKAF